ncbi:MAG: DUF2294 domain-containing protein [Nitrospira sp.]|nr:DUF2294 domain-containing protein [Nitrospira sp.]MDH5251916.1 DUF2294 domain-containing protein [Nitrospira sp.]
MTTASRNKADIEYSIMLAVLNFQKEFMQANYSYVQVRISENTVHVDLTRTAPIPAEERLAQTQEGRAQLRQMHQALFVAGEELLRQQLNQILGGLICEMSTDLEPLAGRSTIVIRGLFDLLYLRSSR